MYKYTNDALGNSEIFLNFQDEIARLSQVDRPVFILGERGTGKENAARSLHYLSKRWEQPFIPILCSALSPSLLEDALFGHEQGSFTGANARSIGYFERADHGTIFLDEVADIPLTTQDKLLRVLEYGTFERIGGQKTIEVDLRIVAATNKNITKLRDENLFRADLLDRLIFDVVQVPPLRMRGSDILLLARHFAINIASELNIDIGDAGVTFSDNALYQLNTYPWYGNIRELRNAIERTVHRFNSVCIDELAIDPFKNLLQSDDIQKMQAEETAEVQAEPVKSSIEQLILSENFSLPKLLAKYEKEYLLLALKKTQYKQVKAAELLGITYNQFRNIYRKYFENKNSNE